MSSQQGRSLNVSVGRIFALDLDPMIVFFCF